MKLIIIIEYYVFGEQDHNNGILSIAKFNVFDYKPKKHVPICYIYP